jgi:hypothetical protein
VQIHSAFWEAEGRTMKRTAQMTETDEIRKRKTGAVMMFLCSS